MPTRAFQLPSPVASRVVAGLPVLRLDALRGADLSAGDVVHLTGSGSKVLGTAVADPANGVARVLSAQRVDAFDGPFFAPRITDASAKRMALGLPAADTTAYRLLNAEGDGLSGFTADVFGDYVVLHVYSHGLLPLGRLLGRQILDLLPVRGVVLKVRPGGASRPGPVEEEILGASPPRQLVVEESGVPYEIHPLGSLNVGLFTDMREHRRRLARSVEERRVLNLFAYTGSLSVVAGRHGATSVTSVDLSPGVLRWARKNFQLSGMDPDAPRFRFESADAPRFVRQALARADEYDLVILDPPAVSAARPSSWSLKNDYSDLISQASGLLPPEGGELWVASNARGDRPVMRHVEAGMRASGRSFTVIESGGLPPDYPVPAGYPAGLYLEVFRLAVE